MDGQDWPEDKAEVAAIRQGLASRHWRDAEKTFAVVRELGFEGERLLLSLLPEEMPKQMRLRRIVSGSALTACGLAFLWLGLGAMNWQPGSPAAAFWLFFFPMIVLLVSVFVGATMGSGTTPTRVQKRTALCLVLMCETVEDVHSVGPLLEGIAFWFGPTFSGKWTQAAMLALSRLLPRLRPEDAEWLTQRQIGVLLSSAQQAWKMRRQGWGNDVKHPVVQLHVAVLKALRQVGGMSVLEDVQRLATMNTPSAPHQAIQYAAQEALAKMQRRAAARRQV